MFSEKRIDEFLVALASKQPVPGGGSSAALSAAQAAALISMVCNLTLGKKGYEDAQEELDAILAEAEALRAEALALLEQDTQAYAAVMVAFRLPRTTEEQRNTRQRAYQEALRHAAQVPLTLAERCRRILELALPAARLGNRWAVSDAGVATLLAEASLHAALLNVRINLTGMEDAADVARLEEQSALLEAQAPLLKNQVLEMVRRQMAG